MYYICFKVKKDKLVLYNFIMDSKIAYFYLKFLDDF